MNCSAFGLLSPHSQAETALAFVGLYAPLNHWATAIWESPDPSRKARNVTITGCKRTPPKIDFFYNNRDKPNASVVIISGEAKRNMI
jgi:hypothetical protein